MVTCSFGFIPVLAKVTALDKKGLKPDRADYRPVSLTGVYCKIRESLMRDHIMN